MSTDSVWDEFPASDYITFENPGDTVTGTITSIGVHTWADGKKSPQIGLATADGDKTLTAGQVQLAAKLRELRPGVGDVITVTFTRSEKRDGGKTLKHFDVTTGGAAPAPPAGSPPF